MKKNILIFIFPVIMAVIANVIWGFGYEQFIIGFVVVFTVRNAIEIHINKFEK